MCTGTVLQEIQCVHSGKRWTSSGKKGEAITQSGSKDTDAATFTITKQADGTYRIMDSKGFYVGVSGASMKNSTNIILWTKASESSQNFVFEKVK